MYENGYANPVTATGLSPKFKPKVKFKNKDLRETPTW
jgi:hypothetical protein